MERWKNSRLTTLSCRLCLSLSRLATLCCSRLLSSCVCCSREENRCCRDCFSELHSPVWAKWKNIHTLDLLIHFARIKTQRGARVSYLTASRGDTKLKPFIKPLQFYSDTHQSIQVLLFLCHLLLCTTQPVRTFSNLLLQTSNLRRNPVNSIIIQSQLSLCQNKCILKVLQHWSGHRLLLSCTYLCVCSFFVIFEGAVFVLKKRLKLSDPASHFGYLKMRRQKWMIM